MEWESEISYANLGWGEAVRETFDGGYIVVGNLLDYGSDILRKINNSGNNFGKNILVAPTPTLMATLFKTQVMEGSSYPDTMIT